MQTTSSKSSQSAPLRQHLERVRHCINVTVTHLTTVQALIPADAELETASRERAHIDQDELARHRANLESAMREMVKLARVLVDHTRASAGLDPQCCDWPSFEDSTRGEC